MKRKGTYAVDIALHAGGEVEVDDAANTFEVHSTSHDFCSDHHPTFTLPHSYNGILTLLLGHSGM